MTNWLFFAFIVMVVGGFAAVGFYAKHALRRAYQLRVYQSPSGKWAGIVTRDGEEQSRIGRMESPWDVEQAARKQWPDVERVE